MKGHCELHACPSGPRGLTQVQVCSHSWVRVPPHALSFTFIPTWPMRNTTDQIRYPTRNISPALLKCVDISSDDCYLGAPCPMPVFGASGAKFGVVFLGHIEYIYNIGAVS